MKKIIVLGAALMLASPASASVISTFDTGNQGWSYGEVGSTTSVTPLGSANWLPVGGNPGGYIQTNDVSATIGFIAPAANPSGEVNCPD